MGDIEASEVRLGCGGRDAWQLAVRGVCQALHAAESAAAGDLRIEVQEGILLQAQPKKKRGGERNIAFWIVLETERARIG